MHLFWLSSGVHGRTTSALLVLTSAMASRPAQQQQQQQQQHAPTPAHTPPTMLRMEYLLPIQHRKTCQPLYAAPSADDLGKEWKAAYAVLAGLAGTKTDPDDQRHVLSYAGLECHVQPGSMACAPLTAEWHRLLGARHTSADPTPHTTRSVNCCLAKWVRTKHLEPGYYEVCPEHNGELRPWCGRPWPGTGRTFASHVSHLL